MGEIDRAVDAIEGGGLVIYPTETVYGLGADALDASAVERVFEAKGRPRSNPMALAVESVARAREYVEIDADTRAFMQEFLPGPVTVICERRPMVPEVLTAGDPRVGVRIPDHELARRLLTETPPLTATSANPSGEPPVTSLEELDRELRDACDALVDGGPTPGGVSTVVDVTAGVIYRRGLLAGAVESWLDAWRGEG